LLPFNLKQKRTEKEDEDAYFFLKGLKTFTTLISRQKCRHPLYKKKPKMKELKKNFAGLYYPENLKKRELGYEKLKINFTTKL
jgi:hypothetical protein